METTKTPLVPAAVSKQCLSLAVDTADHSLRSIPDGQPWSFLGRDWSRRPPSCRGRTEPWVSALAGRRHVGLCTAPAGNVSVHVGCRLIRRVLVAVSPVWHQHSAAACFCSDEPLLPPSFFLSAWAAQMLGKQRLEVKCVQAAVSPRPPLRRRQFLLCGRPYAALPAP